MLFVAWRCSAGMGRIARSIYIQYPSVSVGLPLHAAAALCAVAWPVQSTSILYTYSFPLYYFSSLCMLCNACARAARMQFITKLFTFFSLPDSVFVRTPYSSPSSILLVAGME